MKHFAAAISLAALLASGNVQANEWEVFGINNAQVKNDAGRLVVHCHDGNNGATQPALTFFIDTKPEIKATSNGFVTMRIVAGERVLANGGERLRRHRNNLPIVVVSPRGYLDDLKAGSQISFNDQKFSLKGSSKAFTECFKDQSRPVAIENLSKVDVIGLRTGMTIKQSRAELSPELQKHFRAGGTVTIPYQGKTLTSGVSVTFPLTFWAARSNGLQREVVKLWQTPPNLPNEVVQIERTLSYDPHHPNSVAPLLKTVIGSEGLQGKYGPSAYTHKALGSGHTINWLFDAKTGKPLQGTARFNCSDVFTVNWPMWLFVLNDKRYREFQRLANMIKRNGCGPVVTATYVTTGERVRHLKTTLIDVPRIVDNIEKLYTKLKAETHAKEQKLLKNAEEVKPKF